jgi:SAM-dependent methyltransferase
MSPDTKLLSEIQRSNKTTYDLLALEYEERVDILKKVTSKAVNIFVKELSRGDKVLETGCGVGSALKMMERKGIAVTGIDISPQMIKYAKKRSPESKLILGDFLDYRFKQEFDGVFSFAFIHLFPKDYAIKVIKKMFSLLKPGGILYVGTTKSPKSAEGWELKKDYKRKHSRFRKHWRQEEIEKVFKDIGFKKLAVYIIEDPYKKVWMDFVLQKPD